MLKIAAQDLECGYLDETGFFYNWADRFPHSKGNIVKLYSIYFIWLWKLKIVLGAQFWVSRQGHDF